MLVRQWCVKLCAWLHGTDTMMKEILTMLWTQKATTLPQKNPVHCMSVSIWGSGVLFSVSICFLFLGRVLSHKRLWFCFVSIYLCPISCSRTHTLEPLWGFSPNSNATDNRNAFYLLDPDRSIRCFLPLTSFVYTLPSLFPNWNSLFWFFFKTPMQDT